MCQVSHFIFLFLFQSGEAIRWWVCYQRGQLRLVYYQLYNYFATLYQDHAAVQYVCQTVGQYEIIEAIAVLFPDFSHCPTVYKSCQEPDRDMES